MKQAKEVRSIIFGQRLLVHHVIYLLCCSSKPKSALHGLLHFAAALIPLGLFVAALQPNVLYVNSSQ